MTDKKIPTINMNSKHNEANNNTENTQHIKENEIENKETNKQQNDETMHHTSDDTDNNNEIMELTKQIEELKQQNKTLEDKLLYLAAELQNTKKRNAIDLDNANKFAINKFAIDAVGIFDILQTAINNVNIEKTDKTLYDGIKMTIGEFEKMFERIQIKKINPEIGSLFDHNKHEAISRVQNELEVGCIVNVVRVGYELYGRLLRPAMVIVSGGK